MFGKLLNWLKIPVEEAPAEIAFCEFECGESECQHSDWESCEPRLEASCSRQQEQD